MDIFENAQPFPSIGWQIDNADELSLLNGATALADLGSNADFAAA